MPKKTILFDLILLIVLIGGFFGIFLGHAALVSPDEGRYCEIAREMVASGNFLVPHLNHILYFEKPPLFYWLQTLSVMMLGLSEWSMRFWTACFGLLGCLMTYLAGRKFYSRTIGLMAAFILATSLLYYTMAHLATLDMTVTFFMTASLILFLCGTTETVNLKRRLMMWATFTCAALAVLAKGLIGIVFPIMIVGLWVLLLNKWKELKKWYLPSSILIFLIIALPWHVLLQLKHPEFFHFYFVQQHFARYTTAFAERAEPVYFYSLVFLLGFFPWSVFIIQAIVSAWPRWRDRKQYAVEMFLLIWLFSILLFFSISQSQLIPYVIPIFPPAALLVSRYFSCATFKGLNIGFITLLVMTIALSIGFSLIPHYYPAAHPFRAQKLLITASILIMITSLASCVLFWLHSLKSTKIILILGTALFCIASLLAISQLDHRSIKPMAGQIMRHVRPRDEVVSYNHYYQDLPFYTRRRVTVVNCQSELDFGMRLQNTSAWMIGQQAFWKRFFGKRHLFIVTRRTDYQKLRKKYPTRKFYVLGKTERNIVFSNHEVTD